MNRKLVLPFAVVCALLASFAHAQPKPALVQDHDEPGRNPFQVEVTGPDCDVQVICAVDLPAPVPANRRLVVTQLSVYVATSGAGGNPVLAVLTQLPGFAQGVPTYVPGAGAGRTGTFAVRRYYEAGATPRVLLTLDSGTFNGPATVLLVGHYVVLP